MKINAKPYPYNDPFEPKWTRRSEFLQEYQTLNDIGSGTNMCGISPTAYANGHFFLVWNLCPDKLIGGAGEPIMAGVVDIEVRFGNSLADAIDLIMYGVFENTVEITHSNDVIRNWV